MDFDKFAEEMIISQQEDKLTDYCIEHWDDILEFMPNKNNDMDTLIELASKVGNKRSIADLENYQKYVEDLKSKF